MFFENLLYFLGKINFFIGALINKNGSFPKPLKKEEEAELFIKAKNGDKQAKDKLITHNLRLVAHVVKKYNGAMDSDDLISIGSIGLIKAVNSFETDKGISFATFASRCIENEILMALRANKKRKNDVYIFDSVGVDKEGNELTILDLLSNDEEETFNKVDKEIEREKFIKLLREKLTEREFTVIALRYGIKGGKSYPQREVARFLKISRSYISRIEKKAILKLKNSVKKGDFYC